MKLIATTKAEQNQAVCDPWTVVHFAVGLAGGLMNLPTAPLAAGAVAYELLERPLLNSAAGKKFFAISGPEIPANAVVDVLVFLLGVKLGHRWNEGRTK